MKAIGREVAAALQKSLANESIPSIVKLPSHRGDASKIGYRPVFNTNLRSPITQVGNGERHGLSRSAG
jgi:hypothetical protein